MVRPAPYQDLHRARGPYLGNRTVDA
jgi:hypothetical protein